jgi:hypothetical protein
MRRRHFPVCLLCLPSDSAYRGPTLLLVLRIAGILVVLTTAAGIVLFLLTRDRKYLRFAYQTFKYALIFALLVLGLLALERAIVLV